MHFICANKSKPWESNVSMCKQLFLLPSTTNYSYCWHNRHMYNPLHPRLAISAAILYLVTTTSWAIVSSSSEDDPTLSAIADTKERSEGVKEEEVGRQGAGENNVGERQETICSAPVQSSKLSTRGPNLLRRMKHETNISHWGLAYVADPTCNQIRCRFTSTWNYNAHIQSA